MLNILEFILAFFDNYLIDFLNLKLKSLILILIILISEILVILDI